jgi:hypothetical protein
VITGWPAGSLVSARGAIVPPMPQHFAPLPDRIGYVGGVESLTLDGRRHYFGFDYQSDVVLTPLIDDPEAMAVFASEYLRQTTGQHDVAYWAEHVAAAAGDSSLTGEESDRTFTSEDLRGGVPEPGTHLLYLLGAATEWENWFAESPEVAQTYERLGFDEDDSEFLDQCLEVVRKDGIANRPDEWAVARFHVTTAAQHAPGNWGILFGPLAEGVANQG